MKPGKFFHNFFGHLHTINTHKLELLKMILPVGLPVVFSLYFDIFDGLLQAYVFVFLTSLYIDEITE